MSDSDPAGEAPKRKDYTRKLGVIESFVAITRECPSGPVRAMAERALDAIKQDSGAMRQQVYYVLAAMQGWRGERASQIHASLTAFYEQSKAHDREK